MYSIPDIRSKLRAEDEAMASELAGTIIARVIAQMAEHPRMTEWAQSIEADAQVGLLAIPIVTHAFNAFRGDDGKYPYTASGRLLAGSKVVVWVALKDLR